MSAHDAARALREVADMVEQTGVTDLGIRVWVTRGYVRVGLTLGRHEVAERTDVDAIAEYLGGGLAAGHSRGEFWYIHTPDGADVRLPSGARVSVHSRVRGRPLDLAPLPVRRRAGAR